jgi:hypothetical protein
MNNVVPFKGGTLAAAFQTSNNLPDMAKAAQEGLTAGFAAIGYKGKNWRIKHRGEEEILFDERGTPLPTLDVVIVGIAPHIAKSWYDKRYSEGDSEAPDCFSIDGIHPDMASPKKQCASCAACPQNAWGSRVTEAGKKAKACQDVRRIAVVPSGDITNEGYGGPMLLRVPPMSLTNLARYGAELNRLGYQPYMVETRLGFDYSVAYPLITFTAIKLLDDAQAVEVLEAIEDPLIARMLEQEAQEAPAPETAALAGGVLPTAFQTRAATTEPPAPPPPAPPPPVEIPPPPAPAPMPPAPPASLPPAAKKRGFGKATIPVAAPEPQAAATLQQPVAPALPTLPKNMEDAIAGLLKAPSLTQAG